MKIWDFDEMLGAGELTYTEPEQAFQSLELREAIQPLEEQLRSLFQFLQFPFSAEFQWNNKATPVKVASSLAMFRFSLCEGVADRQGVARGPFGAATRAMCKPRENCTCAHTLPRSIRAALLSWCCAARCSMSPTQLL